MKNKTFQWEIRFLEQKCEFYIRITTFILETIFLHWKRILGLGTGFLDQKQNFWIKNTIFSSETGFLDRKQDVYITNRNFILETGISKNFLTLKKKIDWEQDFWVENKVFRLETGFLQQKQDFQAENKIFRLETVF